MAPIYTLTKDAGGKYVLVGDVIRRARPLAPGVDQIQITKTELFDFSITVTPAQAATAVVVLLAGQSNMVGAAAWDDGEDYPPGVLQLSRAGTLIQATAPLEHPATDANAPRTIGLALGFAQAFVDARPTTDLILVPAAVGGTSFAASNWNPGDHNFNEAVAKTNAARALTTGEDLVIFWAQGISDAIAAGTDAVHASQYAARLDAMIAAMRADVTDATTAPVFLAALPPAFVAAQGAHARTINDAILATPGRVANAAVIHTDGLTLADQYHYDAASTRILGQRYYAALDGAAYVPPAGDTTPPGITFPTNVNLAADAIVVGTVVLDEAADLIVTAGPGIFAGNQLQLDEARPGEAFAITFTATDAANNVAQHTVSVTVDAVADTTAPVITFPSAVTLGADAVVVGTPSASEPVSWIVVSGPALFSGNEIRLDRTRPGEAFAIVIRATDAANNPADHTVNVTVSEAPDTTAPTITFPTSFALAHDAIVVGTPVADEPVTWTVVLGPAVFEVDELRLTSPRPGETLSITIRAVDEANNGRNHALTVVVADAPDTTAPTISFPAAVALAHDAIVIGTPTASEAVTWSVASGPAIFVGDELRLDRVRPGESHAIAIRAIDPANNIGTHTVSVTIAAAPDETAPTITSPFAYDLAYNALAVGTLAANEPVTWSLDEGLDRDLFVRDGAALRFAGYVAEGSYTVRVRATDGAGNETPRTITVNVGAPPAGTVTIIGAAGEAFAWPTEAITPIYATPTTGGLLVSLTPPTATGELLENASFAQGAAGWTVVGSPDFTTTPGAVILSGPVATNSIAQRITVPEATTVRVRLTLAEGVTDDCAILVGTTAGDGTYYQRNFGHSANGSGGLEVAVEVPAGASWITIGNGGSSGVPVVVAVSAQVGAPAAVPSAVRNFLLTPGETLIAASLDRPEDTGGAPIQDYLFRYRRAADATWIPFDDGVNTTPSTIITNLAPGTAYVVEGWARNRVGDGPAASATATTLASITRPGAPTGLAITARDGALDATWDPPADDGGAAITDYPLETTSDGGVTWVPVADATSTATSITGLTNGTAYWVRVAATNSAGTGDFGSPAQGTPQAPSTELLTNGDFAAGANGWTSLGDADFAFETGRVRLTGPIDANHIAQQITLAGAATLRITLEPKAGETQDFAIRVGTAAGDGTYYARDFGHSAGGSAGLYVAQAVPGTCWVTIASGGSSGNPILEGVSVKPGGPATAPSAVRDLAVIGVGETSGTVEFLVPSDTGGQPIFDYRARRRRLGETAWVAVTDPVTTAGTIPIQGLSPGTSYEVQVAAENTVGLGAWSDTIVLRTDSAVTAVTLGTLSLVDGKVMEGWTIDDVIGLVDGWTDGSTITMAPATIAAGTTKIALTESHPGGTNSPRTTSNLAVTASPKVRFNDGHTYHTRVNDDQTVFYNKTFTVSHAVTNYGSVGYSHADAGEHTLFFTIDSLPESTTGQLEVGTAEVSSNNQSSLFSGVRYKVQEGAVTVGQSTANVNIGAASVGDVIWIKMKAGKAYVRRNDGPWNGSASANPATNAGGITIPSRPTPLFPAANLTRAGGQVTCLFDYWLWPASAPVNIRPPTMTGDPQEGETMTANDGIWAWDD